MIPCSDDFLKTLKSPVKEMYIKIELYDSKNKYIKEITKSVSKNDIGSISVDKTRSVRRSFSFSLNNQNGDYTWGSDKTVWIDKRVKLFTGLKLTNGTIEYIPQGVYILTEPQDQHNSSGKIVSLTGNDKTYLFTDKRGKFVDELTIAKGTKISDAIKLIAQEGGETLFFFDTITQITPYEMTYQAGDNRWNAMNDLAALAQCEIFYDVNGYLRLKSVADLNDIQKIAPVWSFGIGDGFYAGNVRKMDETQLYNDFVAIGGGSQTQSVRHQLTVTESDSNWKDSPYSIEKIGRITYFHNNGSPDPLLITVDDCIFRNKYSCMQYLGYTERVTLSIAPHFLLDASDIIQIIDNENNVNGRYMIEKFELPLNPSIVNFDVVKQNQVVDDWDSL